MKLLISIITLLSLPTLAQPVVRANLTIGIHVSGQGWEKKKGKGKCGRTRAKKSAKSYGPSEWKKETGLVTIAENSEPVFELNPARKFKIKYVTTPIQGGTRLDVDFEDSVNESWESHRNGDCKEQFMDFRAERDYLTGSLIVGYKMPPNTWVVKMKRTRYADGVLVAGKSEGRNMVNAFNGHLDRGLLNQEYLVWAAPGSEVYQEFKFDRESSGKGIKGGFTVEFLKMDPPSKKRMPISMAALKELALEFRTRPEPSDIPLLAALIGDDAKLAQMADSSTVHEIHDTIVALNAVTASGAAEAEAWHKKTGAMILAHKLALRLLREVAPYCKMEEVQLPSTGKKASVLALKLASFLISRSKARLSSQHFEHYKAFLEGLKKFELEGLTYSDVRNNPELFGQVRKSYDILRNTADLDISPLSGSLRDLQFIRDRFPSVGPKEASLDRVLEQMKKARANEEVFNQSFMQYLRGFNPRNTAKVDAKGFRQSLEQFEIAQLETLAIIEEHYRFVQLGSPTEVNTFIGMMTELIAHNVELFTEQVENFEGIRAYFGSQPETKKIIADVAPCRGL